jgi:outer membrane usher protein
MVPLAKILLLQNLCISLGHAVELNDIPDTGDSRLTQLGLNTTNTATVQGIDLYLDVTLNGANIGLTHFTYHKEQLWANPEVLKQLGFVLPTNATDQIALNDLSDIKVDYNDRQQTVEIIAPLSMLNLGTTVVNTRNSKRPKPTASPGLLLNYNLYGTQTEGDTANLSAYTELRAFNSLGVLSSTALTTSNRHNDSDGWDNDTVRLDTNWSKSFPDKLLTVSAGDILTGSLSWSRSTRLGGLQFGSNFDLQPYMTTTPLPSFFGSATLPSEVELYINGLKQYSGDVPAGPFEINTAPSFSGVGNAQLVLKDALGQNTTLNFSLYDAQRLLQPGLSDWSAELGFVRENYGIKSFDYGNDIAAFGTWRYGVNNRFTAETHVEATDGLSNAGIGGTWLLGDAGGVLSASLAGSKNGGASGSQYSAGYSWNNNRFNVGINAKGTHGEYRDVATKYGNAPARRSEQFSTGYNSQSLGSFGLSYNQVSYENEETTKFASAYWSKSFGRNLRLNLNVNQDINDSDNNSVFLGASFSLDKDIYVNSSVQNTKNRNAFAVDVARSTPSAGGIGWRAQAQHNTGDNSSTNGLAELNYLSPYGEVRAGVSSNNDNYSTFASGSGSLVMMGGGLFPSRQINNSFAVVSTDGIADVPVLLQNNRIGTTNKRGLLLVTPLNAYQANKVSIDPMDLPADLRIEEVSVEATPTDRAGTLVAFNITPARSASVILIDGDRQPIPLGSQVKLSHKKGAPSAVVGFDGEVYLEALEEQNVLEVVTPDGTCTASFDYHKQGDDIPLIGPIICQKVKQ